MACCVAFLTSVHSEAKLKTGKYVMSFLDHIKKNFGVHAVVFVGYQDPEGVKVSE